MSSQRENPFQLERKGLNYLNKRLAIAVKKKYTFTYIFFYLNVSVFVKIKKKVNRKENGIL